MAGAEVGVANDGNCARLTAFDGCLVDEMERQPTAKRSHFRARAARPELSVSPPVTSISRRRRRDVRRRASSGNRHERRSLASFGIVTFLFVLRTATHDDTASLDRPGVSAHARRARYPTECLVRTRSGLRRSPLPPPPAPLDSVSELFFFLSFFLPFPLSINSRRDVRYRAHRTSAFSPVCLLYWKLVIRPRMSECPNNECHVRGRALHRARAKLSVRLKTLHRGAQLHDVERDNDAFDWVQRNRLGEERCCIELRVAKLENPIDLSPTANAKCNISNFSNFCPLFLFFFLERCVMEFEASNMATCDNDRD